MMMMVMVLLLLLLVMRMMMGLLATLAPLSQRVPVPTHPLLRRRFALFVRAISLNLSFFRVVLGQTDTKKTRGPTYIHTEREKA